MYTLQSPSFVCLSIPPSFVVKCYISLPTAILLVIRKRSFSQITWKDFKLIFDVECFLLFAMYEIHSSHFLSKWISFSSTPSETIVVKCLAFRDSLIRFSWRNFGKSCLILSSSYSSFTDIHASFSTLLIASWKSMIKPFLYFISEFLRGCLSMKCSIDSIKHFSRPSASLHKNVRSSPIDHFFQKHAICKYEVVSLHCYESSFIGKWQHPLKI